MFWEQFADDVAVEKGVGAVLAREHFTLSDLLNEDDILQGNKLRSNSPAWLTQNVQNVQCPSPFWRT
jgi:hypothetical protein